MQTVTNLGRLAVVCLCVTIPGWANPLRYQSGVRNSFDKNALNPKQQQAVLQSLRAKTGWPQLDFDENGFLVCPQRQNFTGGSAAARRLLSAALNSSFAFDFESHNNVQAIAFARLMSSTSYQSRASGARIEVYPLQLDFADFNKLRGSANLLESFDLGIIILHELAHGVWQLRDARARDEEPGECETYINEIRRELNLPERQNYYARVRSSSVNFMSGTRQLAELVFVQQHAANGKVRSAYDYLQWDAQSVGNIAPFSVPQRAPELLLTER